MGWEYGYDGGKGVKELRRDLGGEVCAGSQLPRMKRASEDIKTDISPLKVKRRPLYLTLWRRIFFLI